MTFTVTLSDSDVAALRAGLANGGVIPGAGREFGRHVRDRIYAQVIEQIRGDIPHTHTPAQLDALTPEATRGAFAELRGLLGEERKP